MKLIFILIHTLGALAMAGVKPAPAVKHELKKAITVSLTPQGQKFFEENLPYLLENFGVDVSQGFFSSASTSGGSILDLNEIEAQNPSQGQFLKQVNSMLSDVLTGQQVPMSRPAIQLSATNYQTSLNRAALMIDPDMTQQMKGRQGAIMVMELEASQLQAASEHLRIRDLSNPMLGDLGLNQVALSMGSTNKPLAIRMPFYVGLDKNKNLKFEVLGLEQNFDHIPFDVSYQNLQVPKALMAPGYTGGAKNRNQITQGLRQYIAEFTKIDLPQKLNNWVNQTVSTYLQGAYDLPPPGKTEADQRGDFLMGIRIHQLSANDGLSLDFDAYVEDTFTKAHPPIEAHKARSPSPIKNETLPHDLAFSVDRAVINRVLQLSFQRGYFEKIPQSDGSTLTLRAPPSVDYVRPPTSTNNNETFMKLSVVIENEPESMALQKKIELSFDIITKLVANTDGIEIVLHEIDMNSVKMDPKFLSGLGRLAPGKVMAGIKDRLKEISEPWKTQKTVLPGKMDLLPYAANDIQKMTFAVEGYLLLYVNFRTSGLTAR